MCVCANIYNQLFIIHEGTVYFFLQPGYNSSHGKNLAPSAQYTKYDN